MKFAFFAVFLTAAGSLSAQTNHPPNITWGAETDFNYRYVWQGLAYTRGPVMQPSVSASWHGISATAWANQILNNEPSRGTVNEFSFTLEYSKTWTGWTIEPDFEVWISRTIAGENWPNTSVAGVRVSHRAGRVSVFSDHTFDVRSFRGAYTGDAGVAWERIWHKATFASSASGGWASSKFNAAYIGPAKDAFNLISAHFSATLPLPKHVYLRPHVDLSDIVDKQLRRAVDQPGLWSAGLAIGVNF